MTTRCECCGNLFPDKHIVIQTTRKPIIKKHNYYIPHAIRIFGLFFDSKKIRQKLDQSKLTDYLYILPCDEWYNKSFEDDFFPTYGWRLASSANISYWWLDNR